MKIPKLWEDYSNLGTCNIFSKFFFYPVDLNLYRNCNTVFYFLYGFILQVAFGCISLTFATVL